MHVENKVWRRLDDDDDLTMNEIYIMKKKSQKEWREMDKKAEYLHRNHWKWQITDFFKECFENNEMPFLVVSLLGSEKWAKSRKFLNDENAYKEKNPRMKCLSQRRRNLSAWIEWYNTWLRRLFIRKRTLEKSVENLPFGISTTFNNLPVVLLKALFSPLFAPEQFNFSD